MTKTITITPEEIGEAIESLQKFKSIMERGGIAESVMMTDIKEIFALIEKERNRQDKLWKEQQEHSMSFWLIILTEEIGEVAKAILRQDKEELKTELIQLAAVAVAALQFFNEDF